MGSGWHGGITKLLWCPRGKSMTTWESSELPFHTWQCGLIVTYTPRSTGYLVPWGCIQQNSLGISWAFILWLKVQRLDLGWKATEAEAEVQSCMLQRGTQGGTQERRHPPRNTQVLDGSFSRGEIIWLLSGDQFSSDQLLSHVRLFATPWTAACQASLSITNFRSSLRLTSIESVMPSSHLILCRPLLLLPLIPPSIRVFSNESTLHMGGGQSTGVPASASFLPKKSQGWSPSEWTGWISLQSKGLSRVFSNTTVQKHQFFHV